ncbi:asparaginase [Vicingaceae bacterium]|nr:asparaginase [Vicingaceae bacterium]
MERKKIKILYTGGTIGSELSETQVFLPGEGLENLLKDDIEELKDRDPEFDSRQEYIPEYDFERLPELLDSSNIGPKEWNIIAEAIEPVLIGNEANLYDGILILHGTDTMAYTASALSFMLEGLQHCKKNVVVTGSQIPYYKVRTDARDQIVSAMILTAHGNIPEVVLYFDKKALRGCRSIKYDSWGLGAFSSPGFPVLGTFGIEFSEDQNIKIARSKDLINLRSGFHKTRIHYLYENTTASKIGVIKMFPGMNPDSLWAFAERYDAIIIEGFGSGNGPTSGSDNQFLKAFRRIAEFKIVLVLTQCPKGFVSEAYGSGLTIAGGVNGRDMTTEAALAKMHYLFSKREKQDWSNDEIKKRLVRNTVGELTPEPDKNSNDVPKPIFISNIIYQ